MDAVCNDAALLSELAGWAICFGWDHGICGGSVGVFGGSEDWRGCGLHPCPARLDVFGVVMVFGHSVAGVAQCASGGLGSRVALSLVGGLRIGFSAEFVASKERWKFCLGSANGAENNGLGKVMALGSVLSEDAG